MTARQRKTVEEIYSEVKGYDLVLTVDAPLADALNARLEKAVVGNFAETPRRYAFSHKADEIDFKREIFLEIIDETDLSWKQASYILENILESWKNTGDLYSILENEQFSGKAAEKIIKILESTNNPFIALEQASIDEEKAVAVIAPYQFNSLDHKILPQNYDTFDIFREGGRFELPEFNVFSSASEIVTALKQNITEKNAEKVALIVDSDTRYQPLIESAFQSSEIPYSSTVGVSEQEDVRTFISLARLALSKDRIRLRDVQPVVQHLGIEASDSKNNLKLGNVENEHLSDFIDFLNVISFMDFQNFLEGYEEFLGRETGQVREVIEEIGLQDSDITQETISKLEYYLDSFDPAQQSKENGVLLASPKSTVYVDRPVVFYIGMSSEWTQEVDQRPWIDEEEAQARNLEDFEAMIQNGEEKFYMVQDKEMNEEISPCLYFTELYGLEGFSDHETSRYSLPQKSEMEAFETEDPCVEVEEVEMLSQSSLNRLVQSPRTYYFSRLVQDTEEDVMVKGNLFHEFAEFYANFPEFVEEEALEKFMEVMKNEIRPYVEDIELDKLETEFRVGVMNIMRFVDSREKPENVALEPQEGRGQNVFADYFGKELDKAFAELSFRNRDLSAKGKIDLVLGNELVDYKSSSRSRSKKKIVEEANIELFDGSPDFQPLIYLCELRDKMPGQKLKFTYFYFLSDMASDLGSASDIDEKTVSVTYYPKMFDEKILDLEVFEWMIKDVAKSNDRRKALEKLGHENFKAFFEDKKIPHPYDKDELVESEFASELAGYMKKHVGDYKYVEKGAAKTLRKLVEIRKTSFFKEDLNRFEDFLDEKLEDVNRYKEEGFPVGDFDLDGNPYEDMIIE